VEAGRFRFGAFEFDPGSGELRPLSGSGTEEVKRLPPQPARLLAMLAERNGKLVSREEIREHVWPGVQVDFDTSLHFCIRQIRAALDDSATEPRYIETLPRRGYRLRTPVERAGGHPPPRARRWPYAAALLPIVAGAAAFVLHDGARPVAEAPLRVGIMPFEPPGSDDPNGIAERILEELTAAAGARLSLIGPTSTVAYARSDASLQDLAADYRLDYLVNGRFLGADRGGGVLAELIRASDGAHVWVRSYDDLGDERGIALEISTAVARELSVAAEPVRTAP
jgi:DNA-binding winged helix-turn-helix (wHTH) protein/TolB-like protein